MRHCLYSKPPIHTQTAKYDHNNLSKNIRHINEEKTKMMCLTFYLVMILLTL